MYCGTETTNAVWLAILLCLTCQRFEQLSTLKLNWNEYCCIINIIFYISRAKSINAIAQSFFIYVPISSAVHFSLADVFCISQ